MTTCKSTPDNLVTKDPHTWITGEDGAPQTTRDLIELGLGRFIRADRGYIQSLDPYEGLRACTRTLEDLKTWIEAERGSHKLGGYGPYKPLLTARECYYAGVPRSQPQSCGASEFVGGELAILDVDGLELELVDKLEAYLSERCGYLVHTSKSHDPRRGKGNKKYLIPLSQRLSGDLYQRVCERLSHELGEHLQVPTGPGGEYVLDTHAARLQQPETLPYFESEELEQFFEIRIHHGRSLDVSPILAEVRREIEAEEVLAAQVKEEILTGSIDARGVDRVSEARKEIASKWLCSPGEGVSNSHLFMGALVCKWWALTVEEATELHSTLYGAQGHAYRYCADKIRAAYAQSRGTGIRLRGRGAECVDLEALVYEAEGAGNPHTHSTPNSAECVSGENSNTNRLPTHTANSRYLRPHTIEGLRGHRVHLVRAPTGCGKTTALAPVVSELVSQGHRVIATSHRITLCSDIGKGLGLPSYTDTTGSLTSSAVVCLPSIGRVDPWAAQECDDGPVSLMDPTPPIKLAIGDEIEQIIRSLFSSICKDNRAGIYSALKSRLLCSQTVVLQDADLGPLTVAFVRSVWGESLSSSQINVIDHQAPPGVRVLLSESRPHHLMRIMRTLEDRASGMGPGLWEYNTSQSETIARARWARETFPSLSILEVHSDTIEDVRHILEDKKKLAQYDVVLCSPTLGSGFNFDTKKLNIDAEFAVFGSCRSFCGSLAQDCKQGLSRVRHPHGGTWTVLVEGASQDPDTYHRTANDYYQDLCEVSSESERLLSEVGTSWDDIYDLNCPPQRHPVDSELCKLWSHVQAHKDRWSRLCGPQGALAEHLRSCGYDVEYRTSDDEDAADAEAGKVIAEATKEAKKKAKALEEKEVFDAAELEEDEAANLQGKQLKKHQERALRRFKIQSYTGLAYDEVTIEHVRWWGGKRATGARQATAFADLINVIEREDQAVLYSDYKALNMGSRVDLKNRYLKAKLLSRILPLYGLGDIREDARNMVKLTPPKDLSKKLRATICKVWGYRGATKKSPLQVLSYLLKTLGIKLKSKSKRTGGSFTSEYWLDLDTVSWSEEVSRHRIEQSRRDRRDPMDLHEDLYLHNPEWNPNSPEIQALLLAPFESEAA